MPENAKRIGLPSFVVRTVRSVLAMTLASTPIASAVAADGTTAYETSAWEAANHWLYGIMPSADGAAIIPPSTKTVNITGTEQVNRIELPNRGPNTPADDVAFAEAGSLTFTGTDGGINFENTTAFPKVAPAAKLTFAPTVGIPNGVVATFGGGNAFTFADVSGSGTLKVADKSVTVTAPAPAFTGTVDLSGGDFLYTPSAAGSLALASLARSSSGMILAYGSTGKAATVTMGALGPRQNRAILEVGAGNKRTLGTDDKVFVTDVSTVPVHDGIVDPVILARGEGFSHKSWDDLRADFVTYDETDGFKRYTPTKSLGEAAATDVALVDAAVSSTTKAVKGVAIEYATKSQGTFLTVPAGATLTVGDGTNPAAVLINTGKDKSGAQTMTIAGDGTIAFGGSEGIVALATGHPNSKLTVKPTITGSNGLTFMNAVNQPSAICLAKAAGWTGPTHIWNERLQVSAADRLPTGGDVYVDGEKGSASGSIWFDGTMTLDQHFHVRGHGGLINQPYGVFWAGDKTMTVSFTGSIELLGDADFNAGFGKGATTVTSPDSKLAFACPITGTGLLTLAGANYDFNVGSSVSGIDGVYLRGEGTLTANGADFSQAGLLKSDIGTKSVFKLMDGTRFGAGVQSEGAVKFITGTHTLVGESKIDTLALEGGAELVIDGRLVADVAETALMDGNAKVVAANGKTSVFEVNAATDRALAINVGDGEGKLDFVKSGAGTLKLGGTLAYTGKTVVKEGTLTFAESIMDDPGISWWFDATDASKLTKNDAGKVMAAQSKVGTQKLVNWKDGRTGPKVVNKLNGLDVFTYANADDDGFKTENETCQRTVFLVDLPRTHYPVMSLYGDYGDRGVRADASETTYRFANRGYITSLFNTGLAGAWQVSYELGKPQIIAMTQRADSYTATAAKEQYYSHYQAYIGEFYQYGGRAFDGDIAEMIAFNRVLTDEEILQVQKYLAERWGLTLARQPAGTAVTARPAAASALEIMDGATLDLAGCDLTVDSLTGAGAIVNTGSTPATLVVTGTCDFRGTIGAGATLKASGNLELAVATGGGLDLTSGTTTLGKNYFTPMADSLALWLDASRPESITADANGLVTEWRSLAGRMSGVISGTRTKAKNGPAYGTDSDGKPACCFAAESYLAAKSMAPRTVIVEAKLRAALEAATAIWGLHSKDAEWRAGNGDNKLGRRGFTSGVMTIEHANGTSSLTMSADDRFISVTRFQDGIFPAYSIDEHFIDGADAVNCVGFGLGNNYNGSVLQDVNEVLVYERYLTDDELAPILEYLRDKWIRSAGATVGRQPAPVLAEGVTLGLAGGTTDLSALGPVSVASLVNDGNGGTLTGDVTVGGFVVDAHGATSLAPLVVNGNLTLGAGAAAAVKGQQNLAHGVQIPALSVTGTWTGTFATESIEAPVRKWQTYREGNDWGVEYPNGLILLFR